ncbi:hypothetical protein BBR01nite_08120 [Brevibacillus brevis]|nr:hypothetical protein BBR01nite_08120 [Brevibacillus brevis]
MLPVEQPVTKAIAVRHVNRVVIIFLILCTFLFFVLLGGSVSNYNTNSRAFANPLVSFPITRGMIGRKG